MKNKKTLTVLCILLLFMPTYIAIFYYKSAQKQPVDTRAVEKIDFTDTAGQNFIVSKANSKEEAAFIELMLSINTGGKKQGSLPAPLQGSSYFKVIYYSYNKTSEYHYYIGKNPAEAYYTDPSGSAFYINKEDAEKFLSCSYAASIYPGSALPTLNIGGDTVLPTSADWKYKAYSGVSVPLTAETTSDTARRYSMNANFPLNFSVAPDSLTVTVYENDKVLFDDVYEKISNLTLDEETDLRVKLHAKWYENTDRSGQGEAFYEFAVTIKAPASFYIGRNSIEPGEFVVLTAKNVSANETISFQSEPSIEYEPVFFADGEYMRALIPIKAELTHSSYVFTLSAGGTDQKITLNITPKTFRNFSTTVPQSEMDNGAAWTEFQNSLREIAASSDDTIYFSSDPIFSEGVKDCTLMLGFGHIRKFNDSDANTYRHLGVDYSAKDGTEVYSVNAGKVIYVGSTTYSGQLVVIEHGLGLKSWYCHLGTTNVSVGDIVTKEQLIGTSGSTGFAAQNIIHIGMSVFDVPVCPYALWPDGVGIHMTNP